VTEGAIQRWERGTNQPSLEFLHKIADQTGASIDYITGRSDDFDGQPAWWPEGPESPLADLDAAVKQRRRGDERRQVSRRQRRP
jgi:transcriptional regulator with XRE-family HTH domain